MKWAFYVLAALLLLIGVVWFFQGINVLPGSFMTGQIEWAFAGVGCIVLAVVFYRRGQRY